jgi:hypothetical protein
VPPSEHLLAAHERMCDPMLLSDAFSTRTLCSKLRVASEVDMALRATQAAFNAAAS